MLLLLLLLVQEHVIQLQFLFYVIEQLQIPYNVVYDDFQIVYDVLKRIYLINILIESNNEIPNSSGVSIAFSSIDLLDGR
jgi:hypothetical protein